MKYPNALWLSLLLVSAGFAGTMQSPESLFDQKCGACHLKTRPTDMSSLIAPPAIGVMRHVKTAYHNKKSAVAFVVDYVLHPSEKKALCMPQKIRRFGLMPSQKGNVTKEELEAIAAWMYDRFPPEGLGCGKGHGMGMGRDMHF